MEDRNGNLLVIGQKVEIMPTKKGGTCNLDGCVGEVVGFYDRMDKGELKNKTADFPGYYITRHIGPFMDDLDREYPEPYTKMLAIEIESGEYISRYFVKPERVCIINSEVRS